MIVVQLPCASWHRRLSPAAIPASHRAEKSSQAELSQLSRSQHRQLLLPGFQPDDAPCTGLRRWQRRTWWAACTTSAVGRMLPSVLDTCTSDTSLVHGPISAFTSCAHRNLTDRSCMEDPARPGCGRAPDRHAIKEHRCCLDTKWQGFLNHHNGVSYIYLGIMKKHYAGVGCTIGQ